jgi:cellulase/cellobiase CelA1
MDDWQTVNQAKQAYLNPIEFALTSGGGTTTTPVATTTTPAVTTTTPVATTTTPVATTTTPVATTTTPVATTTTPVANSQYSVQYSIASQWNTGYNISVTVVNKSGSPVNNWTISWQLAHGETFANYWNAQCSISGSTITCSNLSYNGTLGANGGSQNFGAQFNSAGGSTTPTSFTVNGVVVH